MTLSPDRLATKLIVIGWLLLAVIALAGCVTLSPLQQELVIECPRRDVPSLGAFIDNVSECSTLALRTRL